MQSEEQMKIDMIRKILAACFYGKTEFESKAELARIGSFMSKTYKLAEGFDKETKTKIDGVSEKTMSKYIDIAVKHKILREDKIGNRNVYSFSSNYTSIIKSLQGDINKAFIHFNLHKGHREYERLQILENSTLEESFEFVTFNSN